MHLYLPQSSQELVGPQSTTCKLVTAADGSQHGPIAHGYYILKGAHRLVLLQYIHCGTRSPGRSNVTGHSVIPPKIVVVGLGNLGRTRQCGLHRGAFDRFGDSRSLTTSAWRRWSVRYSAALGGCNRRIVIGNSTLHCEVGLRCSALNHPNAKTSPSVRVPRCLDDCHLRLGIRDELNLEEDLPPQVCAPRHLRRPGCNVACLLCKILHFIEMGYSHRIL